MERGFAARYEALYRHHWWWRAREAILRRELREVVAEIGGPVGEILDIGCGNGLFFSVLEQYGAVRGVEGDAAMVDRTGPRAERIFVGDFDEGYDPRTTFGLITMLDVLEHLPEPVGALHRVRELLRPDGRVLLTVPALHALWTAHDDLNQHRARYHRAMLRREAEAAGLMVLRARYLFRWTVPAKLVNRGLESLRPRPPAPPRVPSVPVGRALEWVSRAEDRLIGARIPVGSSLLAVLARA